MTTPISIQTNNGQYFIVEGHQEDDRYNIGDHVYFDSDQDGVFTESDLILSDRDEGMLREFGIANSGLYGRKISALRDYVSQIHPVLKLKADEDFVSGSKPLDDDVEKWLYLEMACVMDSAQSAGISSKDYNDVYSMDYMDALHAGRTLYLSELAENNLPLPVRTSFFDVSRWFGPEVTTEPGRKRVVSSDAVYREVYMAELQMFTECLDHLDMPCVESKVERMRGLADRIEDYDDVSDILWSQEQQKLAYADAARSEAAKAVEYTGDSDDFSDQGFLQHISNAIHYADLGGNLDEMSDVIDKFDFRAAYSNHFDKLKQRAADYAHHKMYADMDADLDVMERIGGRVVGDSTRPLISDRNVERAKREVLAEIR